jgi:gliding motility associated protien GldN
MKKIFIIILLVSLAGVSKAQPKARRVQAQQQNVHKMTERAKIMFPTMASMPEDVVWRRDIYRKLNLMEDANAGLYYPVEPVGNQMNLFTYIFKLMMRGNIHVYEYRLDGNESFDETARVKPKDFLDNYHIYYEKKDRGVFIDNSDIPSKEVKAYYLKECAYYDQNTSTFHRKVMALCPIMYREDDFGDGATAYPLFWIKYDDLAPYLAKQQMMTSNLNNAAVMSIDDYFTLNLYDGKIYKTTNMLGKTLAQDGSGDTAVVAQQKKIEQELIDFEKNIWGDKTKRDSIERVNGWDNKIKSQANRRTYTRVRNRRAASGFTSPKAARVTVRRERH